MMTAAPEPGADRIERIERIVLGLADDMAYLKTAMTHVNARLDDTNARLDDTNARLDDTNARLDDTNARLDNTNACLANMSARLTTVEGDVGSMKDDLAVMKGWQTELAVERRAHQVFARLCDGELLRIYPQSELRHYTRSARQAGSISRAELAYAESIDFILEGTDAGNAPVMYAAEVSYAAGPDDIDRAVGKAALLARLLGREVRPAVIGARFTAEFETAAAQEMVAYTYIHNGDTVKR